MRFEELASRAGTTAAEIGRRSVRPPFSRVLDGNRVRKLVAGGSTIAAVALVVFGAVLFWPISDPGSSSAAEISTPTTSASIAGEEVPESCPVTRPGDNSFIPASAAPQGPPSVYEAVWYGTPDLWTMVEMDGQVWEGLPVGSDGSLTQKTLWWSEHLSSGELAEISLIAEPLDGTAPTVEVHGSGEASSSPSSPSYGMFMVVGIELPRSGCWRITTEYREVELSYVAWVPGANEPSQTFALLDGSDLEIGGVPDLDLAGFLFTIEIAGIGPSNVDLSPGLDPVNPTIVDETAVLESNLGDGVRLWRADREGQPFFLTVDLDGWAAVLHVGNQTAPPLDELRAVAHQLAGSTGTRGVILSNHTPESFTTYLRGPGSDNQVHLVANRCVMESITDAEKVDDPRVGEVIRGSGYASWCDKETNIEVKAYGDESFVDRIVAELTLSRTGSRSGS